MKTKNKKVLVFLPFLTHGGAETQGLLLAKGLKQKGYDVEICGFKLTRGEETLVGEIKAAGMSYFTLPFAMNVFETRTAQLKAFWNFGQILSKKNIDVVIPFTWWCNFLSAIVFRLAGVKQCFWNQRSVDEHVPSRKIEKLLPIDKLTFVSNSNPGKKFLRKRFSISDERIHIINNGIKDIERKKSIDNNYNLLIQQGDIVAVMMANFFREKDAETVLHGINLLQKSHPNIKMLFVGNANSQHGLEAKAKAFDLQLCKNVFFLNSVKNVNEILEIAHIGVLSSTSEGCPNSILEYISFGLPVLATNIEAIADVTGKYYPFLFNVGDEFDFTEKILPLIESKELRKEVALQLHQNVLPRYSSAKMVDGFMNLIT